MCLCMYGVDLMFSLGLHSYRGHITTVIDIKIRWSDVRNSLKFLPCIKDDNR